jgi:hypothetical protein
VQNYQQAKKLKKPVNAQFKNRTVLPPVPLIGAAHSIYNLKTQLAFLHHPWSGLKEEFFPPPYHTHKQAVDMTLCVLGDSATNYSSLRENDK